MMRYNDVMCLLINPEDEGLESKSSSEAYEMAIELLKNMSVIIESYENLINEPMFEKLDLIAKTREIDKFMNYSMKDLICSYYEFRIKHQD